MSDEELFGKRRPRREQSSGGSSQTVKTLLIVFGILAGVGVLSCCGLLGAGYLVWQKNFSQLALTAPADIQKLTAEMTDITIPAEFVPTFGNSILGIKTVVYQWCPTGNCAPGMQEAGLGTLTLTLFPAQAAGNAGADMSSVTADQYTDEMLKQSWFEHTKSEWEVDIRGKKCKFFVVRGEQLDFSSMMGEMEVDTETEPGDAIVKAEESKSEEPPAEAPAATPDQASERKGTGKKTVQISGSFPGKTGEVTLNVHLPEADFQEEKILSMLKSIR